MGKINANYKFDKIKNVAESGDKKSPYDNWKKDAFDKSSQYFTADH